MLAQASPVMKKATVRLMELSADEKARQLYEARLKEQRDNYAREQGATQRGLQKGLQLGIQQGAKQALLTIAQNALDMKMSVEDIIKLTGLPPAEIDALNT